MDNNYWVLYASHAKPKFFKDAGGGQKAQREASMKYVSSYRNALDIGSNIGQWTRPLAKIFDKVICFEPNPNFRECFKRTYRSLMLSYILMGSAVTNILHNRVKPTHT